MRQPMLLENLRDRTRKAKPGCKSIGELDAALSNMKGVVVKVHRPPPDGLDFGI